METNAIDIPTIEGTFRFATVPGTNAATTITMFSLLDENNSHQHLAQFQFKLIL